MRKIWTGDKSYIVVDPPKTEIDDDGLMAFVDWCRMNNGRLVADRTLVRRVFDAYAEKDDEEEDQR